MKICVGVKRLCAWLLVLRTPQFSKIGAYYKLFFQNLCDCLGKRSTITITTKATHISESLTIAGQ